jgi:hypothetical protein
MDMRIKKLEESLKNKNFKFKERHVLYNFEKSPSDLNNVERTFVRYHFVFADDRFIEEKIERIQNNFQEKSIMNFPFESVNENRLEGKFKGTKLKYLLVSFDTEYTPSFLSFKGVSNNVKKDKDLRERNGLNIKDYVQRLYE